MPARLDYIAAAPDGMRALGQLHAYIARSGLPSALIDLVYLRVSQINACAYCIDMHSRDLLAKNVPVAKILLLQTWREGGALFDATERAALAWAERVTRVAERGVPDVDYESARALFAPKALADLTLAIGVMNAYNRLAISFAAVPAAVANSGG